MKRLVSAVLVVMAVSLGVSALAIERSVEFEGFEGAEIMSMAELAERVEVKGTNVTYDESANKTYSVFISMNFMPNPHESSFEEATVPPDDYGAYRDAFAQSLVSKAESSGLPAGSLRIALKRIAARERSWLLPVSAYTAWNGESPLWVIICKRVSPMKGGIGHFNVFGYSIATGVFEFEEMCK